MKRLSFVTACCCLFTLWSLASPITANADEITWYQGLPTASTAEELFGTHRFSTERDTNEISTVSNMYNTLSVATSSSATALEELITSDTFVYIPYNGHSEFVEVIAKVDADTYVDVTSIVTWKSEDDEIACAYDGRIMANNQGMTTITASLAGVEIVFDVEVEDYIDLEAEIERLNSLYPNSPGSASTYAITQDERDAILARGKEMLDVSWTPTQNLTGWKGNHIFTSGQRVTGIPYTQSPNQKNATGFLNALSASDFYTSYTTGGNTMPRYGNDCSGFLSFAWNLSRNTTYTFTTGIDNGTYAQVGSYAKNTQKPSQAALKQSYDYLKRGDGLVYRTTNSNNVTSGHALLVTAIDSDNELVYVYEQTPPKTTIRTWTYQSLAEGYYKPFTQSSTDGWYKIDGYWFYYEDDIEISGWKQIDGFWYYFLPENHRMATSWQEIDGVWYYLNPNNGAMHEGWLLYEDDWYYLKSGSGAMASNESLVIDGTTYHFDASGVCTNP